MSRPRRPGAAREEPAEEPAEEPGGEPVGADDGPTPSPWDPRAGDRTSAASFDEAEALFRAALAEVRGLQAALGEARTAPDADEPDPWAVRPDATPSSRRRRTPPRTGPVQETPVGDGGRPSRRRRGEAGPPAVPPTGPPAVTPAVPPAVPTGTDAGRTSRRGRRTSAPPAPPVGVGDPDDLTGDLFAGRGGTSLPPAVESDTVPESPPDVTPDVVPEVTPDVDAAMAAAITAEISAATGGPAETGPETDDAPTWAASTSGIAAADGARARRRAGLVAAVAAGLAVALVLALLVLPGGDDEPALRTAPAARYTFATATTPEGVEVSRTWELRGSEGDRFVGRLVLTNPRATPLSVRLVEVIPKEIAPTVAQIRFRPEPVVVQADPVVRYDVTIPPGGRFTATYAASVAPEGPRRARLAAWALLVAPVPTPPTTPTTAPPATTPTTVPTPASTTPRTPGTTPVTTPTTSPPAPPPPPPPPPPTATGVIVMRVSSQGGTGSFLLTGPGAAATVETAGSPNGFGQAGFTVPVGVQPWTLQPAEGWELVGGSCQDRGGSSDSSVVGNTAFFAVQADETVICTFTVRRP
jgi:hypothetical protein